MGSYAGLYIHNKEVFKFRNEVNPDLFYLFDVEDKIHLTGLEAIKYSNRLDLQDFDPDDLSTIEIHTYKVRAKTLLDRLHVLGFGEELLRQTFEELKLESIECNKKWSYDQSPNSAGSIDLRQYFADEAERLSKLTYEQWLGQVHDHVMDVEQAVYDYRNGPLEMLEDTNERVLLRAILQAIPEDTEIELDVSDLYDGGWLDDEDDEAESANRKARELNSIAPIILTEGVFDRNVLKASLKLHYPHIANRIKFLDTDFKTEGGAGALVKLLKSFAAAGIQNRILAVFDNDTAAAEALTSLEGHRLPNNYRVICYPYFNFLKSYPTLGPQGAVDMDINGLAGSIELYLGSDALKEGTSLRPVQWTGYSNKIKAYQGEVNDKGLVQKSFLGKLKDAQTDPRLINTQDWSGIKLIINKILAELSSL